MNAIDVCGLLGSAFIVVMFIPEINHVYKHRDAKAINYNFLHLNLTVSVLYLRHATLLLRVRCAHFNFFCLPCVVGSTCMNRRAQDQDVR